MDIYKYKSTPFVIKEASLKDSYVQGYFSTFDILDSDGDIGRKGMFKKTIEERGPKATHPRIKYFLNHSPYQVPGVIKELEEDNVGLAYGAAIGSHNLGVDYIKMIQSGIITEHSYGYQIVKENRTSAGNELLQAIMWEGSGLTAWGANQFTPVTGYSKSLTRDEQFEKYSKRIKDLEKFCRHTDATDETIEIILIEVKQLSQVILDLTNTTPAVVETPEPGKQADDQAKALFERINKSANNIIKNYNLS